MKVRARQKPKHLRRDNRRSCGRCWLCRMGCPHREYRRHETNRVHDLAEDWPSCQYERQDAVGIDYHPSAKPPPKPRPLRPSKVQI